MAAGPKRFLSLEDLDRAARAVAEEIDTDEIVIIGSQALLVAGQPVLRALRMSREFDLYPSPSSNPDSPAFTEAASHAINAHFGEGTTFSQTHGFFIDAVSSSTATLPEKWRDRAVTRMVQCHDGRMVKVVAPSPDDLVASKLARGDPKDLMFASLCLASGRAKRSGIKASIETSQEGEERARALQLLDQAAKGQQAAMAEARRMNGDVDSGAGRNPLDDIDAIAMLRRIFSPPDN